MHATARERGARLGLAAFVLACLGCLGWPVFPWVASVAPLRVLGLPFSLVWSVAWILAALVAVGVFHLASGGERRA